MRFIPNRTIFYAGQVCRAGQTIEIDAKDKTELEAYGTIEEPRRPGRPRRMDANDSVGAVAESD